MCVDVCGESQGNRRVKTANSKNTLRKGKKQLILDLRGNTYS